VSDDLEDVSVVETVDNTPSAEPAPVAVEPVVETSSETVHADEQVFVPSTKIGTAEDYTRQQVAEENGTALGNGNGDGRTLTEAGRHAKAAAAEEEKDRKLDAIKASQKDWLDKPDHDFGGIKMSGHDLARMIDFISNPQMQDKLRERLGKTGMPKDKVDKGMKELNEYIELKKKEQEGQKLTEEQQRRLKELEKSEEFRVVAQAANELHKSSLAAEITVENKGRVAEKSEISTNERSKDFSDDTPPTSSASSKVVSFSSYASNAITTSVTPQEEFNLKAVGKTVDVAPRHAQIAQALSTSEPTVGLGI
jgi:hypothetical protein